MERNSFIKDGYLNDMLSSAIIFIVTYLLVLYISIFSTAFIAFTNGLNIPISIIGVDFDTASSSVSNVWDNVDNIFLIFSFAPLVLFILLLSCIMFLRKAKSSLMEVVLFWMVFNCALRLVGDLTFGLIFHLWQTNLLTDFLGLTASLQGKLIVISLGFISMALFPLLLRNLATYFFDPIFTDNLQRDIIYNFVIPAFIGAVVLMLWFLPSFSLNEIGIIVMSVVAILVLARGIYMHFNYINLSAESKNNDGFNIVLPVKAAIVILAVLVGAKITLNIGFHWYSSAFEANQLSNIFHITLLCILGIFIIVFVVYLFFKKKEKKQEILEELQQTDEDLHSQAMPEEFLKGTRWESQDSKLLKEKAEKIKDADE